MSALGNLKGDGTAILSPQSPQSSVTLFSASAGSRFGNIRPAFVSPVSFFFFLETKVTEFQTCCFTQGMGSREATAVELQDEFHEMEEPEPMAGASARLSGETLIVPQILAVV